ncbi:unnamed protein product [Schistosoma curassoni]|uniref:Uncharacterized protein n=1 Tax=Schistosoma curassoni TaxID=6186 RepID=A0A183K625_9TREM|nr:unnamed protein product [Schistosoma curassoni]
MLIMHGLKEFYLIYMRMENIHFNRNFCRYS